MAGCLTVFGIGAFLLMGMCTLGMIVDDDNDSGKIAEPPKSEFRWKPVSYRVFSQETFGGDRAREGIRIEIPTALTPEQRLATCISAAVDRYLQSAYDEITVWAFSDSSEGAPVAQVTFNSDGHGARWEQNWPSDPRVPGWLIAELEPTASEKKQLQTRKEELACKRNLECWGEKHSVAVAVRCPSIVERAARYDFEWTDGWLGVKFSRYGWADMRSGVLRYYGDKIKFQNGFGAWQNMRYWVKYDPNTEACSLISIQ